eukprot:SAG31_NODE_1238_length_9176_cov_9.589181_13_plen_95_part_00
MCVRDAAGEERQTEQGFKERGIQKQQGQRVRATACLGVSAVCISALVVHHFHHSDGMCVVDSKGRGSGGGKGKSGGRGGFDTGDLNAFPSLGSK